MMKDLFKFTFANFSRWDYEYYHVNYIDRLPHRFLEAAVGANPALRACRGFTELQDLLASIDGRRSQNPELFPYLNYLIIPGSPLLQNAVDALRIHVGLAALDCEVEPTKRFWRLRDATQEVFENVQGKARRVAGVSIHETGLEPFPVIYSPYPHLFDDVEHRFYKGDEEYSEITALRNLVDSSFRSIQRYAPELAVGFRREIRTVGLMARQPGDAKSFSVRNFYIGGIFVSIANIVRLAEQLIHEYYHQCIWPWWLIEPPADLSPMEHTVISPVTGRTRPVPTMIHALLIYCSLIDYYRFVLSTPESNHYDQAALKDAHARLSKIEVNIGALITILRGALSERPATAEIVEFIAATAVG